jgi:hypothetical protein
MLRTQLDGVQEVELLIGKMSMKMKVLRHEVSSYGRGE